MSISAYQQNLYKIMMSMKEDWKKGLKDFTQAVIKELGNVVQGCTFTTVDAGAVSAGAYTGSGKLQSYSLQDTSSLLETDFKSLSEKNTSNQKIAKMIMDRVQQAVTGGTLMIISTGSIVTTSSPPVTLPGTGTGQATIQLPTCSAAATTLGKNFDSMKEQKSTNQDVAQYIADAVKTTLLGMVYTVTYTTGNIAGAASTSATIVVA